MAENWHGKLKALGAFAAAPPFFPALSPFLKGPQAAMAYDWVFN